MAVCPAESWGSVLKMKKEWTLDSKQRCLPHINQDNQLNTTIIVDRLSSLKRENEFITITGI